MRLCGYFVRDEMSCHLIDRQLDELLRDVLEA